VYGVIIHRLEIDWLKPREDSRMFLYDNNTWASTDFQEWRKKSTTKVQVLVLVASPGIGASIDRSTVLDNVDCTNNKLTVVIQGACWFQYYRSGLATQAISEKELNMTKYTFMQEKECTI